MKKSLLGISLLTASMIFTGCSSTTSEMTSEITAVETEDNETINIVASSFYEYEWLTEVIGDEIDNFNISFLINDGVDLHNYEPTVNDIASITSSDLFIYNGGESDTWAVEIIEANPELNAISIIDVLDENVLMTTLVEGMEEEHDHDDEATEEEHDHDDEATEEEHDHDDEATEEDDHDDEATEEEHDHDDEATEEEHSHEDEHVWLSLNNAMIVCEYFAEMLGDLDTENADAYQANAQSYIEQLETLDAKYEEMIEAAARDTIIVTDRFPFLYLANDYDINYYAAFEGCSAETEASFETIVFLAEKVDEYDVNYVLIIDNGLEELASTVISNSSNSDVEVLVLDSMQSMTQDQLDAGTTYYSIMEANLEVLRLALAE